ncbi:CYTH domain-containing protein [Aureispira sp. CCB-E]|uniref:CYTH domain-containing protein n=1 Tax=Aureispira sp. CCB-E TaxID=3051121 RepID=UPI002869389B|nr:CYTH domain-containing protein [Aureispira sp. CCB-E]WMX13071.1 CYTH domain-containing protein [Aureispira sp. CCB-E]
MGVEIERKYLVQLEAWEKAKSQATCMELSQGYLSLDPARTVRIRIQKEQALLTIKGKSQGISRVEFEYTIPLAEGMELLKICQGSIIRKKRYVLTVNDLTWEVDEFEGDNVGLILAEVELDTENQSIELPLWIQEEVSHDQRYFNSNLVLHPFKNWS